MIFLVWLGPVAVMISIVALSWAASAGKEARRALEIPRTPRPPEQVCSCRHGANFHNEEGCHNVQRGVAIKWDEYGDATKYGDLPCDCVRYVGPGSLYDPGLDQDLLRAQKMQDGKP